MARQHIPRFVTHIGANPVDRALIEEALKDALRTCRNADPPTIVIVVLQKGNIPDVLSDVLGADVINIIKKSGSLTQSGLTIRIEGQKTFVPNGCYGVIFGLFLGRTGIDAIDSAVDASAIYLVPWDIKEGKEWAETWSATPVGPATWTVAPGILPTEVEDELKKLPAGNLIHPNDLKQARVSFKKLKDDGLQFEPRHVRDWALRNGWPPKHADQLEKEAAK